MAERQKSTAPAVVYGAFEQIAEKNRRRIRWKFLQRRLTTRSRASKLSRAAWAERPISPVEVTTDRQFALAMRWLVDFADARKGCR